MQFSQFGVDVADVSRFIAFPPPLLWREKGTIGLN